MKRATLFAACCIAIAAPYFLRAQPPASGKVDAPDDQATAQQPTPDAQDDESRPDPSQPPSADVDSARRDESAAVDGVPAWVFDTWCITQNIRPPQGWGISRDHTAGFRVNGHTEEGTWSVVRAGDDFAVIDWHGNSNAVQLIFSRRNPNDASQDLMAAYGRRFEHCGEINFNERF
jgi:hypothetical protein